MLDPSTKVTTTVSERLDQPGYVVMVTIGEGDAQREVKFPVEDFAEAKALAESFHNLFSGPAGLQAAQALVDGIEQGLRNLRCLNFPPA
jgi:hypothetical protein